MLLESQLLKTTEAAVVADVDVHNVNKMIDDDILPKELFVQDGGRRVLIGGCAAINFYVHTADILDASERRRTMVLLMPRLRDLSRLAAPGEQNWTVRCNRFVAIDFREVLADTGMRLEKLRAAQEAVVSDPHILSGTPVLEGTRVPVYAVAAMLSAGIPHEEVLQDHPSLDDRTLELAAIYAKANPQRGRPSSRIKLPKGAKLSSRKSFPRRKPL